MTITGTGFLGATGVNFGTDAGTNFTVVSATEITVTSPAHAAGSVDVTVDNTGGSSAASSASRFLYEGVPAITSVLPATGPTGGETAVTIVGTGFLGTTAVMFGSTAATSFVVNNANSITAVSPAESAGQVDISVTSVGGTSTTSASDHYTYAGTPSSYVVTNLDYDPSEVGRWDMRSPRRLRLGIRRFRLRSLSRRLQLRRRLRRLAWIVPT